jgi:hypothetical protein
LPVIAFWNLGTVEVIVHVRDVRRFGVGDYPAVRSDDSESEFYIFAASQQP